VNHCEQLHLQRIQLASSHPLLREGRDVYGENIDGVDEHSEVVKKKCREERGSKEEWLGEEKGREEKDEERVKYDAEFNSKFEAYTRYVQHVQYIQCAWVVQYGRNSHPISYIDSSSVLLSSPLC
jgi:hypothetical protein